MLFLYCNGLNKETQLKSDDTNISYHTYSGVASIWVDSERGENMIIIVAGANDHLKRNDMEKAKELIQSTKYLAVTLESNFDGILAALEIAKANDVTTIMNAAPARRDLDQGNVFTYLINTILILGPHK